MYDETLIRRVVAPNAGPFTGDGTNSYLVGASTLTLIDPGPDDAAHADAILAAAAGRPIAQIILTHAHRDHVDGLARLVVLTGARTYAMPRSKIAVTGDGTDTPTGAEFVDHDLRPDVALADGDTIETGDAHCPAFVAVHTPGHAPDHMCFALAGTPVLFSGDHVMGWSTSVIAPPEGNMGHYLTALEVLIARDETTYLPGHGLGIPDGRRTARAYLLHRQMREQAVLAAIQSGAATIPEIAAEVYSGLAPALWNAALLSVRAHVEHLHEKRLLAFEQPLTLHRPLVLSS
jgi:glyoxylase-like metal-dependent hydrolase (beta-lactamase superfamily II)